MYRVGDDFTIMKNPLINKTTTKSYEQKQMNGFTFRYTNLQIAQWKSYFFFVFFLNLKEIKTGEIMQIILKVKKSNLNTSNKK